MAPLLSLRFWATISDQNIIHFAMIFSQTHLNSASLLNGSKSVHEFHQVMFDKQVSYKQVSSVKKHTYIFQPGQTLQEAKQK